MSALTILTSEIRQHDGLYSLNDLHQAAGGTAKHRPNQFMRLDTTTALMEEIRCADVRIIPARTIRGRGKAQGTYVCKELVYAYAMWISPSFHLKAIRAFDARCPEAAQVQRAVTYAGMVAGLIQHELVKAVLANPALGRPVDRLGGVGPGAGSVPQAGEATHDPVAG